MPQLSERIQKLKASSTVAFNTKAKEMKRQGTDVIAMTAGEPDFQPPEHVFAAAREALDKGLTKYTPAEGMAELREAVCAKFERGERPLVCAGSNTRQHRRQAGTLQRIYGDFEPRR